MFSDERDASSLAKFLSEFDYVMMDTCSLMEEGFPLWMDVLNNAISYLTNGSNVRIPRECYEELKRHSRNKSDIEKRIAAQRAIKIIKKAKWAKLLEISKRESKKNFADHVIYVKASMDRIDHKLLIITQDKKLASDLIALNDLASQRGRIIKVFKFKENGTLVPNHGEGLRQGEKWVQPLIKGKKGPKPIPVPTQKPTNPQPVPNNVSAAVDFDARLKSVLTNPTYPVERKIEDLRKQLNALSKLTAEQISGLKLNYTAEAIKKLIIEFQTAKSETKKPADSHKKPAEPQQPEQKPQQKPANQTTPEPEKKPEVAKPKQPSLGWYELDKDLSKAIKKVCEHYNVLVRSPSIGYDKAAHGEIDFTEDDVSNLVELLSKAPDDNRFTVEYRSFRASVEKIKDGRYKIWINLSPTEKPVPETPAPAKPEPKKKPSKKPEPEQKPIEESKPEPKPKKKPAPQKTKPEKPKLVEGPKPEEEPKPKKKAKAKKLAEETPAPVPEAPKPAPKKKKPATKKPAEPQPEQKPIPEQPQEEKPVAPSKKPPLTDFEKAEKADRSLRANFSNPNYAPERKVKDIQSQIKRLKKLSDEEKSRLFYNEEALNALLAQLNTPNE